MLAAHEEDDWTIKTLVPARVQAQMEERVSNQEQLHKHVSERVRD